MRHATKLLLILFISLLGIPSSWAKNFDAHNFYPSTYVHDLTTCRLGQQDVSFEIRGQNQYTGVQEANYGEYIFIKKDGRSTLIPIKGNNLHRYRLLRGPGPHCNKTYSLKHGTNLVSLMFLKDNRPLGDKLMVVVYDLEKEGVVSILSTDYIIDQGGLEKKGFSFSVIPAPEAVNLGKTLIDNESFIYQNRSLKVWMLFDGTSFRIDREKTFERFEGKTIFTSKEEFEKELGLSGKSQQYQETTYLLGVNHELKRSCFLFAKTPIGTDKKWLCQ